MYDGEERKAFERERKGSEYQEGTWRKRKAGQELQPGTYCCSVGVSSAPTFICWELNPLQDRDGWWILIRDV